MDWTFNGLKRRKINLPFGLFAEITMDDELASKPEQREFQVREGPALKARGVDPTGRSKEW
jgi:hypothetical protein